MITPDINYWAIVVAVVISMALGGVWYSNLLFAKAWLKGIGKTEAELKDGAVKGYITAITAAAVTAFVLAHLVFYVGATTIIDGLQAGFWVWFGFFASTLAMHTAFERRSWNLFFIQAGYHLAQLLIIGAMLAVWQ